jgi:hypothetical protein
VTNPVQNSIVLAAVLAVAIIALAWITKAFLDADVQQRRKGKQTPLTAVVERLNNGACFYCRGIDKVAEQPDPMRAAASINPLDSRLYWSWVLMDYAHLLCVNQAKENPLRYPHLDDVEKYQILPVFTEFQRRVAEYVARETAKEGAL